MCRSISSAGARAIGWRNGRAAGAPFMRRPSSRRHAPNSVLIAKIQAPIVNPLPVVVPSPCQSPLWDPPCGEPAKPWRSLDTPQRRLAFSSHLVTQRGVRPGEEGKLLPCSQELRSRGEPRTCGRSRILLPEPGRRDSRTRDEPRIEQIDRVSRSGDSRGGDGPTTHRYRGAGWRVQLRGSARDEPSAP